MRDFGLRNPACQFLGVVLLLWLIIIIVAFVLTDLYHRRRDKHLEWCRILSPWSPFPVSVLAAHLLLCRWPEENRAVNIGASLSSRGWARQGRPLKRKEFSGEIHKTNHYCARSDIPLTPCTNIHSRIETKKVAWLSKVK